MAENGQEPTADPAAVTRHPMLFRTIRQRRNPKLRRTDITVTDVTLAANSANGLSRRPGGRGRCVSRP